MVLRIEGERGYEKIFCPECGKEMMADLHGQVDLWLPEHWKVEIDSNTINIPGTLESRMTMDNWICLDCDVVLDRDDLKQEVKQ